ELFPTEIRASAFGIATAISRIGAAIGTFALPWVLQQGGIQTTMLLATGITVLGLVICILWAPETKGKTLAECSRLDHSITRKK
ncbi:MAG TPA: MFS transporter, partial [Clostridiales bacterium]|nr:MFS transporter [Clostridiales bacterium]